eukprot:7641216-Pyramimonas_sp.AAC.1
MATTTSTTNIIIPTTTGFTAIHLCDFFYSYHLYFFVNRLFLFYCYYHYYDYDYYHDSVDYCYYHYH